MEAEYEMRESKRAGSLRITVHPDGRVVVTRPLRATVEQVEAFVRSRSVWVEEARAKFHKKTGGVPPIVLPKPRRGSKAYRDAVAAARKLVAERLTHLNQLYGFSYGTISIRNQKTRWGSCSRQGNVSFNYRIVFLSPELADYLVVHELCHTREHNHSARFWALVARACPAYAGLRKELRTRYVL